jgi:exopolyphosphatase/guanosine-5'-triphosphate,3'-diphosphate pyrophosphatase
VCLNNLDPLLVPDERRCHLAAATGVKHPRVVYRDPVGAAIRYVSYYLAVLLVSIANLALAGIAYLQRAKQIRGNALRERQLALAEARNELAEARLRRLDDQLWLLGEIRDAVRLNVEPPPVGVIDVGSATIRLLVCRYEPSRDALVRLCKRGAYLGLGAQVERHGEYRDAILAEVDAQARKLAATATRLGCDRLAVVVTAPGRTGSNPDELLRVIAAATGREPYLLTVEDEARLAFAGATLGARAPAGGRALVCDVGGGSTEIALGSRREGVTASASFGIGAFALAERHFRHDPPSKRELAAAREAARSAVELQLDSAPTLAIATGGSARAVAKLAGPLVGRDELAAALRAAVSEKPIVKNPQRRRALPAGIVILEALHSAVGLPLTIATGGLREGVLLELTERVPAPALRTAA